MSFPLPQDEELAHQLQMELNVMSDVQERDEGVTVPLHGDLQPSRTVSHHFSQYSGYAFIRTVYCPCIVTFPPFLCIPLPQDEDYARQLQFEFDTSSQGDVTTLLQPSLMVSTACEAQDSG